MYLSGDDNRSAVVDGDDRLMSYASARALTKSKDEQDSLDPVIEVFLLTSGSDLLN